MSRPANLILLGGLFLILSIAITNPANVRQKVIGKIKGYYMQISQNGIDFIKSVESFASHAYQDAGGFSIGYGHYMGKQPVMQTVTPQQAEDLLVKDLQTAEAAVHNYVKVPITQNQHDAMVSLAFNIGSGAFMNSSVVRLLNAGDVQGAADAFRLWDKSQGAVNNALVARRESERAVFLA